MADRTAIQWADASWNPIPGFPGYLASPEGQIRSVRHRKCLLKPYRSSDGYLHVLPFVDGRTRKLRVHHAILLTYAGPRPEGAEGRHLDGDPANNGVDNLAWGTRVEQAADKRRIGTLPLGARVGGAKLTEAQVLEIRQRHGSVSLRALAAEYGVSHTAIRRAAVGANWSHVG